MRAVSTTLDTLLFVLLVGAAIGVLTGVGPGESTSAPRVADETADVLATSTAGVAYEQSVTVETARFLGSDTSRTVAFERTANGTYASLLASAAVAGPADETASLTGTGDDLEGAVVDATARVLPTGAAAVQVHAVWRPYPDARLSNEVVVGAHPPPDADVTAATIVVPSGFDAGNATLAARQRGFHGVARAVSGAVIDGLFPVPETASALRSDGPDRAIAEHRYRTAADRLGVDGQVTPDGVESANDELADGLAPWVRRELVARYDSPTAAARDLRVDRVRIVVRTWSP